MYILTDIIHKCHKRHQERHKLRQRKTVFTPRLYYIPPYHYTVFCARRTPITLEQLETADISFMPIGHAPQYDHGPLNFGGDRFNRRQGIRDWHNRTLNTSWGIQIYTGKPSQQNDAPWHDIYFTYQAMCDAPDAIYNCIETLIKTTANPLLVLTKSGGLRFSCRITDYLHPDTDAHKNYIYKSHSNERDLYLQIRGDKGYSRWDTRYEILSGNLLNPPVIAKEIVFAPIDALRDQLHVPSEQPSFLDTHTESARPIPVSLGSENLDHAKDALLKRGFSYLQQEKDFHYWIKNVSDGRDILLSLWEDRNIVWVRAALPNTEFPTTTKPITDVLSGTGITHRKLGDGLPVNDEISKIRDGKLSPLGIKRVPVVLSPKDIPKKPYQNPVHINNLFLQRKLSKRLLVQWEVNWKGHPLGNFAKALLNALKTEGESYDNGVGPVRAVVQAFKPYADKLIKQMCHIAETLQNIDAFPTVCPDLEWTYWHELLHFFDHYKSDVDIPMQWNDTELLFWLPPIVHPAIKHLLLVSPALSEQHLSKIFPTEQIDIVCPEPKPWLPGNQIFQIRTDLTCVNALYNHDDIWDHIGSSKIAERFFIGIRAEIERDTNIKHIIITNGSIVRRLADLKEKENVCHVLHFKSIHGTEVNFEEAQVVWLIGKPVWTQRAIWTNAQMVFGNDEIPLNYEADLETGNFIDERIQSLHQQHITALLTQIVGQIGLDRVTGKKVVLLTDTPLPDITDRKETRLFDWEDFEIAGGLDALPQAIATRQGFEAERDKLTAESSREEVERVLGCSSRQAYRFLNKLRGGNIPRVSIREQILFLLSTGEKRTAVFVTAIDHSAQAIGNELNRLVNTEEIVRLQRGIYTLPD